MPSEVLLKPFKLAIATGNVKLQEMSLSCLRNLIVCCLKGLLRLKLG